MASTALVPEQDSNFRSDTFWQGFFDCRGDKSFEWYGDWRQLKPLVQPLCGDGRRVLMLGCGNSEISANMYDDGVQNITNIDFIRSVVADMMRKNLRQRPSMKWQVMDMTAMKFKDNAFDVAFDKGGLDALMGDAGTESFTAGSALLKEVERVVEPYGGVYLCVTLAEQHVLRALLTQLGRGWNTTIHKPPPPPDMAQAALQPLLVICRRVATASSLKPVQLAFSASKSGPDAEQLSVVLKVVNEVNKQLAASEQGRSRSIPLPIKRASRRPAHGRASADAFAELHPGGILQLEASAGAEEFSPAGTMPTGSKADGDTLPLSRFKAVVVDQHADKAAAAVRPCAVFIVPQGREHEWMFTSSEGQHQLAAACASKRLIVVSLSRGHSFPPLPALQRELSGLVLPLATNEARLVPKSIPFMTAGEGVGRRDCIAAGHSSLSGPIVVEDVIVKEDGANKVLRRMVFTDSCNLIQSEVVMTAKVTAHTAHTAQPAQPASTVGSLQVDHFQLPCEYHQAIVAGLSLAGDRLHDVTASDANSKPKAMVVGLGGGGLPAYLALRCQLAVTVAELDSTVHDLALRWFDLPTDNLQVVIQDGLRAVAEAAPGSLDVLVIDADGGDASQAMSCPPPPFLAPRFLQAARAAMAPGSVLAINCVTRSDAAFSGALAALQAEFPQVVSLEVSEDVNRVLFALSPPAAYQTPSPAWKNSTVLATHLATPLREIVLKGCSDDTATDIAELLCDLKIC